LVRAALLALALTAPAAAAQCRLALALAFDVSASVDAGEYALMMQATAAALVSDPVVQAALADRPVAMAAYVWAGAREQAVAADWRMIHARSDLESLAGDIARFPRPTGDPLGIWGGRTGLGAAMAAGRELLARGPACDAQTLDIAGDGENNDGPAPGRIEMGAITVNALAIAGDLPMDHGSMAEEGGALSRYFETHVLRGAGAFVISAPTWPDFPPAIARKLERELRPRLLGALAP
jgi:hypothetical protein